MAPRPGEVVRFAHHDAFPQAAPTPDHLIPLLYLPGLASAADQPAEVLIDGYAMGSLSMTSFTLGADVRLSRAEIDGAPSCPADEANI